MVDKSFDSRLQSLQVRRKPGHVALESDLLILHIVVGARQGGQYPKKNPEHPYIALETSDKSQIILLDAREVSADKGIIKNSYLYFLYNRLLFFWHLSSES